jgi:hypothetical protein
MSPRFRAEGRLRPIEGRETGKAQFADPLFLWVSPIARRVALVDLVLALLVQDPVEPSSQGFAAIRETTPRAMAASRAARSEFVTGELVPELSCDPYPTCRRRSWSDLVSPSVESLAEDRVRRQHGVCLLDAGHRYRSSSGIVVPAFACSRPSSAR